MRSAGGGAEVPAGERRRPPPRAGILHRPPPARGFRRRQALPPCRRRELHGPGPGAPPRGPLRPRHVQQRHCGEQRQ
eukprot:1185715-Prorocentrum_minimum.AAC.1